MKIIIHYIVGTRYPLSDLLNRKTEKFSYLPMAPLDDLEHWKRLKGDDLDGFISGLIWKTVNDYLDFSEMVPTEVRMEILAFVYYLLLGMKDEKMKEQNYPIYKLTGWVDSIQRLEILINEKFTSNLKSYV